MNRSFSSVWCSQIETHTQFPLESNTLPGIRQVIVVEVELVYAQVVDFGIQLDNVEESHDREHDLGLHGPFCSRAQNVGLFSAFPENGDADFRQDHGIHGTGNEAVRQPAQLESESWR